mgnify:CR=1 FL=1
MSETIEPDTKTQSIRFSVENALFVPRFYIFNAIILMTELVEERTPMDVPNYYGRKEAKQPSFVEDVI